MPQTPEKAVHGVGMANTFLTRLKGWMLHRPAPGEALLLDPCNAIHAWFMLVTFDAVFLDHDNRIVRVIDSIRPWRGPFYVSGAVRVLELADGRARELGLAVGDQLRFEP